MGSPLGMFSFNFGQKFDVNHPPTPVFRGKNRQKTDFSEVTFLFFVSIFLTCLTVVADGSRFVLLFSRRLYSKID